MIEFALHYASKDWPIFPLVPRGKVPAIPRYEGGRGYLDATTSIHTIEKWWDRWPEANVGIATGTRSGIVGIDVDTKDGKDGLNSIRELMPTPTLTIRTPSGGFHLYYRMPAVRITIGTNLMPGIDWRGDGGYVVGAGSSTDQGMYLIARNLPIADLPANILHRITTPRQHKKPSPTSPKEWARDRTRVLDALAYVDPADYATWIAVGMALHRSSGGSQDGFDMWNAWSAGEITGRMPANYGGLDNCAAKWRTFHPDGTAFGAISLGTVFALAKSAGYQRPGRAS